MYIIYWIHDFLSFHEFKTNNLISNRGFGPGSLSIHWLIAVLHLQMEAFVISSICESILAVLVTMLIFWALPIFSRLLCLSKNTGVPVLTIFLPNPLWCVFSLICRYRYTYNICRYIGYIYPIPPKDTYSLLWQNVYLSNSLVFVKKRIFTDKGWRLHLSRI